MPEEEAAAAVKKTAAVAVLEPQPSRLEAEAPTANLAELRGVRMAGCPTLGLSHYLRVVLVSHFCCCCCYLASDLVHFELLICDCCCCCRCLIVIKGRERK